MLNRPRTHVLTQILITMTLGIRGLLCCANDSLSAETVTLPVLFFSGFFFPSHVSTLRDLYDLLNLSVNKLTLIRFVCGPCLIFT